MNENAAQAAQPAFGKTVELNNAFVGKLREIDPENDPTLVRFGYNPGQRRIWIPGREVGGRDRFVPVGEFFPMTTFKTPRENCTLDEYKDKEYLVDVTAQDVETRYRATLGLTDMGNWGFQTLFYGERDVVKVIAINEVVLPTLQEIRGYFEDSPIDQECPGEDEMDLAVPRSMCASCHLKWIDSEACTVLIADAIKHGRTKAYIDYDGTEKERHVKFTAADFETARKAVRFGLTQYLIEASRQWQRTVSELESKKRDQIQDAEHFLRKDLHQIKPANKEVEMVERMAKATTGNTHEVLAKIAEGQAALFQVVADQGKVQNVLLEELLASRRSQDSPAPADKKPAKAANKTEGEQ